MTLTAILLLCAAAVTHAGWNLIGKRSGSSAAAYLTANIVGAMVLFPGVVAFAPIVHRIPPSVYRLLLVTGFFQALYYRSLSSAYRAGDMSVAYPLARAVPILLVSLISALLGRPLSHTALGGFLLIVVGALLLPLPSFRELSSVRYRGPLLVFALLAAVGTTGYSLVDSHALTILRSAAGGSSWKAPIVYSFFEALASGLWLLAFVLPSRSGRQALAAAVRPRELGSSAALGIGIYLTYTLVLISMGFVSNVSYVVAFRQLSIPIGVTLSILFFHEPAHPPKIAATVVMVTGLLLTALG